MYCLVRFYGGWLAVRALECEARRFVKGNHKHGQEYMNGLDEHCSRSDHRFQEWDFLCFLVVGCVS